MSFSFRPGSIPLLVSIPHNGCRIPDDIGSKMTPAGQSSRDTDWFLDRLYDLPELTEASFLIAEMSRYVIDLNRPSTNESLYPGQTTTGLVPLTCFDGTNIYPEDPPSPSDIDRRIEAYWRPYHTQLESELKRLVEQHGRVVLVEAHSIASRVPRLFEGQLPDFNLGTNCGKTCAPDLQKSIEDVLTSQSKYTSVVNGRFVGGYITRNYGIPAENQHAIQFELSQSTYMEEASLSWAEDKAAQVQPVFQNIFSAIIQWIQTQ